MGQHYRRSCVSAFALFAYVITAPTGRADDEALANERAAAALHKATDFYRNQASTHGAYLWQYSADLSKGRGEGNKAIQRTTGWVQPPGTPSVGLAYLNAYEATGDHRYLKAATETAHALANTQLESGGWDYRIEFGPRERKSYAYRADDAKGKRNTSTLDDNNSQEAIRLLMRVDRALGFDDALVHNAAQYALESLLRVQYPNGAWPQRFSEPPDPQRFPVKKANYPKMWSRKFPKSDYRGYYTFNDNSIADVIDVLLEAAVVYDEPSYKAAAAKGGDFILLAQMPDPQPAWAQQYNADMEPAWARRFEPPSISGGESFGVMAALIQLYRHTGDKKYLEPIPRALAYLRSSRRPDGKMARFYELQTNRPLYFDKEYNLTYSDADMPTHYGFVLGDRADTIEQRYKEALGDRNSKSDWRRTRPRANRKLARRASAAIASLDDRGAWVESGGAGDLAERVINSRTFNRNVGVLCDFIAARPGR